MEKFNITLTEGYFTCSSETLMKLSEIFQDLEHLYHIQKIAYGGHYVHPLGGGYIIFAFSAVRRPMSGVRCPVSRMVSAHLKEKY